MLALMALLHPPGANNYRPAAKKRKAGAAQRISARLIRAWHGSAAYAADVKTKTNPGDAGSKTNE